MADAAVAQQAYAEVASQNDSYPRFEAVMDKWGYDWEAHKVTTEDDYILTTFHVTGKTGKAKKAPT